ncbi:SH3 domain-containing protein [Chitinimonas sp.]|uniref:SH3 domain-containing protein n=1 Tax=Chitinimonas sp. TaxID=1934313 RepID=UPI0035B04E34
MRQPLFSKLLFACLFGMAACVVSALEFRSTAEHGTAFYDAPNPKSKRLFVASRGFPVEVLVENKDWLRVRDQSGALAWVEKKALLTKRTVVVSATSAGLHSNADGKSPLLFQADKGVIFDLVEVGKTGWVKVKHRDGASGFLRIEEVWGI